MHRWTTLALTLVSAVTLASAGTPAATSALAAPLAAASVQLVETPQVGGVAIHPALCDEAESEGALSSPIDADAPDFTPVAPTARPKRGYCACGCSFTPDCTTDADCGGGRCLKAPTCC